MSVNQTKLAKAALGMEVRVKYSYNGYFRGVIDKITFLGKTSQGTPRFKLLLRAKLNPSSTMELVVHKLPVWSASRFTMPELTAEINEVPQ
jgi:hypothetical protein